MKTLELDLFAPDETEDRQWRESSRVFVSPIRGLDYVTAFVTPDEEARILHLVDIAVWSNELARRVQHYGYKYDYKARKINDEMHIGELPKWLRYLGRRLVHRRIFENIPDQVIVNEYMPGQGISPHVDCEPCFGDTVASLSLNSTCMMDFTDLKQTKVVPVFLEPRSIVVLKGEARYLWKHSIAKRKQDLVDGQIHGRQRRVSLTFRAVKWG